MKRAFIQGEAGFWSSVFLVMMVSLGTMALSAYYMMNKETENSVNSAAAMQVDYSANGAVYWGLGAIRDGILDTTANANTAIVTIGGIDVDVYLSQAVNNGRNVLRLDAESTNAEGVSRTIEVDLSIPSSLADLAIGAEGLVDNNIIPYDEDGSVNYDLIQENITLPDRDTGGLDGLFDLAIDTLDATDISSGYTHTPGDLTDWADNPGDTVDADPVYYWEDGQKIPFVVYVQDDPVKFFANKDYYGFFLVEGNVRIQSGHTEIYGVIMQLDITDTITDEDIDLYGTTGERPKFHGGVYSYGSVHAKGGPTCEYVSEYTSLFASLLNEDIRNRIVSWKYVSGDDNYDTQ